MGERFIHVTTPERLWTHMRVGGGRGGRSSGGGGSERASERAAVRGADARTDALRL